MLRPFGKHRGLQKHAHMWSIRHARASPDGCEFQETVLNEKQVNLPATFLLWQACSLLKLPGPFMYFYEGSPSKRNCFLMDIIDFYRFS